MVMMIDVAMIVVIEVAVMVTVVEVVVSSGMHSHAYCR